MTNRRHLLLLLLLVAFGRPLESASAARDTALHPDITEAQLQDLLQHNEVRIPLNASLQLALRNNFQIAIQRMQTEISDQQVVREESAFDPTASVTVAKDRSVRQTGSALALPPQNENEEIQWNAGIANRWRTGTETELQFTNRRDDTNSVFAGLNPSYTSDLILSLTQPLLKDFGLGINTTGLRIASNNREISDYQFKEAVMEILFDVESTYWELVYAREELLVKEESLRLAEDFLKITRRKVEVGVLPEVEILQAEAERAAREEGVITAEDAVRDTEDLLRKALNLTADPRYWDVRLIPSDDPAMETQLSPLEEVLRAALTHRPDLNQARIDLENKHIQLKFARNQTLPRLDLVGSLGLSGLAGHAQPLIQEGRVVFSPFDGNYSDALEELRSKDHYDYSIGLQLAYPLGNRAARSEKVMADLETQQALFALRDLENEAIQVVREAYRQIETNRKRIAAASAARKLAEERLRTETRRFEVGLATSHDVLEFQEKLAVAKSNELRAIIDHRESLMNLDRVQGTLLESKGIVL
jgi:outer membrane protein TolC